jgi:hypothetical protein
MQNVQMLLPQTVDACCDFDDHRTIAYHTFTDFMLFSVQTGQNGQPSKKPDSLTWTSLPLSFDDMLPA